MIDRGPPAAALSRPAAAERCRRRAGGSAAPRVRDSGSWLSTAATAALISRSRSGADALGNGPPEHEPALRLHMTAEAQLHALPMAYVADAPAPSQRARLVRRARRLAWLGLSWHLLEAAIAIAAGVVAGSIALVGFGADSLIEAAAGVVVLWLMAGTRSSSPSADRRAQQLIGASFLVLLPTSASRQHATSGRPSARRKLGRHLRADTGDHATTRRRQTSRRRAARLLRHGERKPPDDALRVPLRRAAGRPARQRNARLGWADPLVALAIAAVAVREARDAWRRQACTCCSSPRPAR